MFGVICTPHDCRREDTTRSVNISAASAVHGNVCHTHHGSETSGAAVLYKCEHMSMAMTLGLVPGVRPSVVVVFFFFRRPMCASPQFDKCATDLYNCSVDKRCAKIHRFMTKYTRPIPQLMILYIRLMYRNRRAKIQAGQLDLLLGGNLTFQLQN